MKNLLLVLAVLGVSVLGSCESNTPETPDTPDTPDTIPVTGITLNESSVSLMVGDTWQLTAEIQPENADNRTVSWESSDNGTATVDESGLITAIAVGEAVITATVEDKSATCTVTVSEPAQNGNIDMTGMSIEEVRAAIDEALAAGFTELRFTGDFAALGISTTASPMDSSWTDNPLIGSNVEVIDLSGVTGWPEVDVDGLLDGTGSTATDGVYGLPAFTFSGLLDGEHTFPELRKVILPEEVEAIGSQALWNNPKLETIVCPGVKYVGNQCLVFCSSFNSIDLPEATTVYTYAFRRTALTAISLPKVVDIHYGLFMECSLTRLELTAEGDFTIHEDPLAAWGLGEPVFNFETASCELVLNADKHYGTGTASPKAASATNWFETEWGSITFTE